jgi:hypothetical protein
VKPLSRVLAGISVVALAVPLVGWRQLYTSGKSGCTTLSTPADCGQPVAWPQDTALSLVVVGPTATADPIAAALGTALAQWLAPECKGAGVALTSAVTVQATAGDQPTIGGDVQMGADCPIPPLSGPCLVPEANGNRVYWVGDPATWQVQVGASSLTIGVTALSFEQASGKLVDADIALNGDLVALPAELPSAATKFSLCAVLQHEAGHALGLGHSSVGGATMQAEGQPADDRACSLEPDDRAGVCAIYGQAATAQADPAPAAPANPAAGCQAVPAAPDPTALLWASAVLCVVVNTRKSRSSRP